MKEGIQRKGLGVALRAERREKVAGCWGDSRAERWEMVRYRTKDHPAAESRLYETRYALIKRVGRTAVTETRALCVTLRKLVAVRWDDMAGIQQRR